MPLTRRDLIQRIARLGGYSAAFSTMQALGMMPQPGPSALPQLPFDFGKGKSVVILGAGIAGLVSAYELRNAGFKCTLLEARERPGGRSWSVRRGSKVEFTDGTVQTCDWKGDGYLNCGPARIPSIHTNLLRYCHELRVPLEVEVNVSRSALMQSPALNNGQPVEQRQVIHDTRGYLAELLSKAIDRHLLDAELSKADRALMLDFLSGFGDLDDKRRYTGSMRAGFTTPRGAGPSQAVLHTPLKLTELLAADFSKGEFYEEQIDWQATMFQPVGGMDEIPYAFSRMMANGIQFGCEVVDIATGDTGVIVSYREKGSSSVKTVSADYCICTMPISVLAKTKNNFTPETQRAFTAMPLTALYKIAWESPRFWETEQNIYGGISFLKGPVDLVWYPTDKMFSKSGVVVSGFNSERDDVTGQPTPFGSLPSIDAKLEASRAAVEALHPGRGQLLTGPIYIQWSKIPYSLGCFANNHLASSDAPYAQLDQPQGRTYFAGDYLSHLVGWQEGAVLSAHRAIERIAAQVKV